MRHCESLQETIARIQKMEKHLDNVSETVSTCPDAIWENPDIQENIRELTEYYESGKWLEDYDRDAKGELPSDLKRGILAQDTVYDLFCEIDAIRKKVDQKNMKQRNMEQEDTTMEMTPFFKSIIEEDKAAIVICDIHHIILYMNPTACERYAKRGGAALIGRNLLDCHNEKSRERINKGMEWFQASTSHNRIYTYHNEKENKDVYMIALRDEQGNLIGYYEKHEYRNRETEPLYRFE